MLYSPRVCSWPTFQRCFERPTTRGEEKEKAHGADLAKVDSLGKFSPSRHPKFLSKAAHFRALVIAHCTTVKRVPRGWSAGPIGSETPSFLETVQRNSKELPFKSVTQTGRKGVRRRHRLNLAGCFQRKLRSLTFSTCTIKRSAPGFMSRHVVNTHHIQFPSGLLLL